MPLTRHVESHLSSLRQRPGSVSDNSKLASWYTAVAPNPSGQCLETFLAVTGGGGSYCHLVGRGPVHRTAPKLASPKCKCQDDSCWNLYSKKNTGFEMKTPGGKSRLSLHISEPISPSIKRDPDCSGYRECVKDPSLATFTSDLGES